MSRAAPRRATLTACLCLAAAFTSSAAPRWSYAESEHFEIYTTAGEGVARDALSYFERVHGFFTDYMHMPATRARPTRLIVVSGDREFKPYRPNEVATAFYQSGYDRDSIVMKSFDAASYPVVVHEYVHLVLRHAGVSYPLWLNEGLAEFFSTIEPAGGRMNVGRVPLGRLKYLNDDGRVIPLARLLAIGRDAPEYNQEDHAGTFYSESWALVHMLMTDAAYRPKADGFLETVSHGADAGTTLSATYGKSLPAVEADLRNYIHRSTYTYFIAPYREPKQSGKLPVRGVDDFEAGLVTANLLADGPRVVDARAAFDALSRQRPDDVSLLESRAFFELRHGDHPAALTLFARAVDRGSTNARLYVEYASLAAVDDARREALLARALALAPDDAAVRVRAAEVQLGNGRPADALATLQPVTRVSDDDAFRFFEVRANAYVQARQWTDAREASASALQHARTGSERSYAEELARRIAAGAAAEPPMIETGRITNVACDSDRPVLEIRTAKGVLRLAIDSPAAIRVVGTSSGQVDLPCGPHDEPVRVGYVPVDDPARKTAGNVRLLDFSVK